MGGGLTRFGMALVKEMNRLGMLVDVSHISERGFWDVLEISEHPVIASHSNCKTLCRHSRNLSNEQLKALAANGGVVGITFVPGFITVDGWKKMPPLVQLLNHIVYAIDIAGIDYVGIGSDFDGGGDLLKDASEFIKIAEGLSERGYSDDDIRKVLGENHLRVFEQRADNTLALFWSGGFRKGARDRLPNLIHTDAFHADIVFALIRELLTGTTGYGVADGLMQCSERLKSDVIAGTE
ncbi:Putative dipeptidase CPC735_014430 [Geodia barretti]|uniref:Dipeptidase n=1 Tax=Geodia barretti TaxID=519541 RepID=A0AA35RK37_GEOBA|nr:Putative dipeptidase CPC735_014430 [Geodia barretti]